MGLWADVIKVMKSSKFKQLLSEEKYEVEKSRTVQTLGVTSLDDLNSKTNNMESVAISIYSNITIKDVTIPIYSRGMLTGSIDKTLTLVDTAGNIYTAYKSGTEWISAKKTVPNKFIARDGSTVDLASNFPYLSSNGGTLYYSNNTPLHIAKKGLYFLPKLGTFVVLDGSTDYYELCVKGNYGNSGYGYDVYKLMVLPGRDTFTVAKVSFTVGGSITSDGPEDFYYMRVCDFTL